VEPVALNDHLKNNLESHICDLNQHVVELEAQLKASSLGTRRLPQTAATAATARSVSAQQYEAMEKRLTEAETELAGMKQRMESSVVRSGSNASTPGMSAEGGIISMSSQRQVRIMRPILGTFVSLITKE
jgi:ferritin-like metal-binding protein YciE